MRTHRRLTPLLLAALVWAGAAGPPNARGALLSDLLLPGATLVEGPMTFSDFTYMPPTGPPLASSVTVSTITDPASGLSGIEFGGGFSNQFNSTTPLDVRIGYTVTTTGPAFTDIHMTGNPTILPLSGVGTASVIETVSAPGAGQVGQIQIFSTTNSQGANVTQGSGSLLFPTPYSKLFVQKDVMLTNSGGVPAISIIDQTFSTLSIVPEPGSVALLGIGCFGLFGYSLRRKRSA